MAQYSVKFDTSQADKLRGVSSAVVGCAQRVTKVSSALKSDDSIISGFSTQAKTAASALQSLADRIKSEASVFEQAVGKYSACEKQNAALLGGGTVSAGALAGGGAIASLFLPQAHIGGKAVGGKNSMMCPYTGPSGMKVKNGLLDFGKNLVGKTVKTVQGTYSAIKKEISPGGFFYRPALVIGGLVDFGIGSFQLASVVLTGNPFSAIHGINKGVNGLTKVFAPFAFSDMDDHKLDKALKEINLYKEFLQSNLGETAGLIAYEGGGILASFGVGDAFKGSGEMLYKTYSVLKAGGKISKGVEAVQDDKPQNILRDYALDTIFGDSIWGKAGQKAGEYGFDKGQELIEDYVDKKHQRPETGSMCPWIPATGSKCAWQPVAANQ